MDVERTDDDRDVNLADDAVNDLVVLPDITSDELLNPRERSADSNDERLLEDRPPHW